MYFQCFSQIVKMIVYQEMTLPTYNNHNRRPELRHDHRMKDLRTHRVMKWYSFRWQISSKHQGDHAVQ